MLIPVRAGSCGKVIAQKDSEDKESIALGEDAQIVLDKLEIERYCCRRLFVGNVDLIDEVAPFSISRET